MALNAKRERLKSLKEKEGVERRNCSSGIAEKYCANLGDKSRSSDILCEAYAVVARVRFNKRREFAAANPVKLAAVNNYSAYRRTVAADKLCSRMNNYIRTILYGSYKIRCCKGIVNNKRNLMLMRYLCYFLYVSNI